MKPLDEINKKRPMERQVKTQNSKPPSDVIDLEQPKSSDQKEVFTFIASHNRFALWIKAIKARYWIHLGNEDDFKVNWQDAKDSANSMVEHIVEVDKLDAQSDDQSEVTYSNLYTLSLHKFKCEIMIQGLFRDHWIEREFPLLQGMVDLLEKGTTANEAYESCSGTVLNISDSELLLSDDDSEAVEDDKQPFETPLCKSNSETLVSKRSNKSPSKRSSKVRSRSFSSPQQKCKESDLIDLYNRLVNRIDQLEDTIAKLENTSADQVMSDLVSNDHEANIIDKVSSELFGKFEDAKKAWKHDMSVIKQQSAQELSLWQETARKLEAENKKLSNKICSIQDQHLNLCKNFKDLEGESKLVQENISSVDSKLVILEAAIESVIDAEQAKPQVDSEPEIISQSTDTAESKEITSISSDEDDDPYEEHTEITSLPADKDDDPSNEHTETTSIPTDSQKSSKFETDVIVLMDSNRKYIDAKRLCPGRKVSIVKCGNLETAKSILTSPRFTNPQVIVLHVGVNDVETYPVADICDNFVDTVKIAIQSFPTAKLIISEITPRNDNLNVQVKEVNNFLNSKFLFNLPSTFMVIKHPNLNSKDCLFDRKHLSKNAGVKRLAADLTNALHEILGITRPSSTNVLYENSLPVNRHPSNLQPTRYFPPRESIQNKEPSEMEHLTKELIAQLKAMSSAMLNLNRPNQSAVAPPPPPQLYQMPRYQTPPTASWMPINGFPMKQPWTLVPKPRQPTSAAYPYRKN